MAMRDIITGSGACSAEGSSAAANPFGSLANALLGSSGKAQELKGLPGTSVTVRDAMPDVRTEAPLTSIPGSEYEGQHYRQADTQSSEFLRAFHYTDHGALANAWEEVHRPQVLTYPQGRGNEPYFREFEQIFNHSAGAISQPIREGPPQKVLSSFLHAFVDSGRVGVPFHPSALPMLGLSEGDKRCIRDRTCIMARHIFSDKNEEYINAQVNALLCSLDIDSDSGMKGPYGPSLEMEKYWNESQGIMRPAPHPYADAWASEFTQQREQENPDTWVRSFEQQHGANGWASEFEQEQRQMEPLHLVSNINANKVETMKQSRMLAQRLAQNPDPKFQNSKFLQFMSKMSRGELIVDDNQIKPSSESLKNEWADEYRTQYNASTVSWADQFTQEQNAGKWVNEFRSEHAQHNVGDQWVNEFSKLGVHDWVEEFENTQHNFGENSAEHWGDAFPEFLNEQRSISQDASRSVYLFSDMNPYVGHPNPLKEGQELFRKGLLSEAVLALEAEVLKNPNNAEGWRLLGITHAENDDDQQAIASMMRAQEIDPLNLEVLLALGVSHTNESEKDEALRNLYKWLQNHPRYGSLTTTEPDNVIQYDADVIRVFNGAAHMFPNDADIHTVLGVLYNLSREHDKAIESFQRALELKPHDYSLWNKLGATQANSIHCENAILAYQKALDLKPNYVRAWANMGIGYANQGLYEESIKYYVRTLVMNPKADNAWQYLKISLTYAQRNDMIHACDSRNLEALQQEFPL